MSENLPTTLDTETDNITKAATSGRTPFLKFKKGDYFLKGVEIPAGKECFAYCRDWRRGWRKWEGDEVVKDLMVRVADDPSDPVERNELDDLDKDLWPLKDGEQRDPWSLEDQLPMEDVETGERFLFPTVSVGGRIAIEKLCTHWGKANDRKKGTAKGLPIISLQVGEMPTKKYGNVPCPDFRVVGWENDDEGEHEPLDVTPSSSPKTIAKQSRGDMDDEIPF